MTKEQKDTDILQERRKLQEIKEVQNTKYYKRRFHCLREVLPAAVDCDDYISARARVSCVIFY